MYCHHSSQYNVPRYVAVPTWCLVQPNAFQPTASPGHTHASRPPNIQHNPSRPRPNARINFSGHPHTHSQTRALAISWPNYTARLFVWHNTHAHTHAHPSHTLTLTHAHPLQLTCTDDLLCCSLGTPPGDCWRCTARQPTHTHNHTHTHTHTHSIPQTHSRALTICCASLSRNSAARLLA